MNSPKHKHLFTRILNTSERCLRSSSARQIRESSSSPLAKCNEGIPRRQALPSWLLTLSFQGMFSPQWHRQQWEVLAGFVGWALTEVGSGVAAVRSCWELPEPGRALAGQSPLPSTDAGITCFKGRKQQSQSQGGWEYGLLRDLLPKGPWNKALEGRQPQASW